MNNARKIIAGLLAVYMVMLVLMQCNDACASEEHQVPATLQSAQDCHEEDNDICSPFCHCSCC